MAMVVRVQWESGKPCKGVDVCAWVNGEGNKHVLTDENGEAYFSYGPGRGEIFCDGKLVVKERQLNARELITCHSSGLFSYSYS